MPDSILTSVKKALGIEASYTDFDADITMHINSVFSILHQVGAGNQTTVFQITSAAEEWESFIAGQNEIAMVRSYMFLRVKILFDPPALSFVLSALQEQAKEMEWRLGELEGLFVVEPA